MDLAKQAAEEANPRTVEVVYPNLKRRLSGVTTSMARLVPELRAMGVDIAALGPGLPPGTRRLPARSLFGFWRRPRRRRWRIWHARRNIEMAAGILLRDVARMPLKLVFTSAAQRQHKPTTDWMIRRMDAVIATSAKSAAFLDVPATVIPHGIDLALYQPPADKAEARRTVGLDPARRYIGCFGRIRAQKGTDIFVDALIRLLPDYPDWSGVITGLVTGRETGFAEALNARIAEAGLQDRILLVGHRETIEPWFRAVDLFAAPARWEGFGLTPLEAMATGVPVVATDVGAFAEMLGDGVGGTLVRETTAEAVARALQRYIEDPVYRENTGIAARKRVAERHTLRREAEALASVYDRLAPPSR